MDADDPWYWFAYDDQWRLVATFRHEDADPKEVFVHHAAGLGGYGGSSYIDSVILRDRDILEAAWTDEAYDKRTQRHYYAQNWRADVSAILTDDGSMVEWVKYSAYGVAFGLPAGDTDSDGDYDKDDETRITSGVYDVRKDVNLDGTEDSDDVDQGNAVTGGNHAMGRGVLSAGGVGGAVSNRRGYAGYEYAPELEGTGAAGRHLYHVRHRVYDADVGRWTRRDPLGYVDGMGLYEYARSQPLIGRDSHGQWTARIDVCNSKCNNSSVDIARYQTTPEYLTKTECDNLKVQCMENDNVRRALQTCSGAEPPVIECEKCSGPNTNAEGYYNCKGRNPAPIRLCHQNLTSESICEVIAHEMIHYCDQMRDPNRQCPFTNCTTRTCTEIRAAALSGQCCPNGSQRRLNPEQSYWQCVERVARLSLSRAGCNLDAVWGQQWSKCKPSNSNLPSCHDAPANQ